jgi:preprotein translocase subunit SecG
MKTLLYIIQIASAVTLVGAILLHTAKGEGMGGIGGAARLFGTPKGLEEGLDKVTYGAATVFVLISLVLAIIH